MTKTLRRIFSELSDRASVAWPWSSTTTPLSLVAVATLAAMLLAPVASAGFRFLGCDWYIEGLCVVGDCQWWIFEFTIYICIG